MLQRAGTIFAEPAALHAGDATLVLLRRRDLVLEPAGRGIGAAARRRVRIGKGPGAAPVVAIAARGTDRRIGGRHHEAQIVAARAVKSLLSNGGRQRRRYHHEDGERPSQQTAAKQSRQRRRLPISKRAPRNLGAHVSEGVTPLRARLGIAARPTTLKRMRPPGGGGRSIRGGRGYRWSGRWPMGGSAKSRELANANSDQVARRTVGRRVADDRRRAEHRRLLAVLHAQFSSTRRPRTRRSVARRARSSLGSRHGAPE